MQAGPQADATFIAAVTHIEQALDSVVDHGSDDELFIASYLQGHFAVISRPMEVDPQASVAQLDAAVTASLDDAFANRELEPEDANQVRQLWQDLVANSTADTATA